MLRLPHCVRCPPVFLLAMKSGPPSLKLFQDLSIFCTNSLCVHTTVYSHSVDDEVSSPLEYFPCRLLKLPTFQTDTNLKPEDSPFGQSYPKTRRHLVTVTATVLRPTDLPSWFKAWVSNPLSAATFANHLRFIKIKQ